MVAATILRANIRLSLTWLCKRATASTANAHRRQAFSRLEYGRKHSQYLNGFLKGRRRPTTCSSEQFYRQLASLVDCVVGTQLAAGYTQLGRREVFGAVLTESIQSFVTYSTMAIKETRNGTLALSPLENVFSVGIDGFSSSSIKSLAALVIRPLTACCHSAEARQISPNKYSDAAAYI
ncbi:hypothetical protein BKA93DRAFT_753380 [Sparassis latifolia]